MQELRIQSVKPLSRVDELSKLCPILRGRQLRIHCSDRKRSFSKKENIDYSNNYGLNGPNRKKIGLNNENSVTHWFLLAYNI